MSSSDATTKAASPTKKDDANGTEDKPLFNAREEHLLKVAMAHCLKSGPPEIDMNKFMTHGEFNTLKTAQNTWGKIKSKLISVAGEAKPEEGDAAANGTTPKTQKTPKADKTPASKKRSGKKANADSEAAEDGESGEAADGSPKKKPRTSPVKKTTKKSTTRATEDAEANDKVAEEGEGKGGGDAEKDVKMEEAGE